LFKILLDPDLNQCGKIEATELKEDKKETVATLWEAKGLAFIFIEGGVKSNYCSQIVDKIFPAVS